MLFIDSSLARRLELAEGSVASHIVDARARLDPSHGALWRNFSGAVALFDGSESPITQVFGLGMSGPVEATHVETIEAFFTERGAPTNHELSPLAGVATYALLAERGYRPIELSNVLVLALGARLDLQVSSAVAVRVATEDEGPAWVETSVAGWTQDPAVAPMLRGFVTASFASASTTNYFARIDGADVATAALGIHEGIALLAGASTIASARNRGAQQALLTARLLDAKKRGCDVAMMAALPGSVSQRNAERNGFRVAYSRTKWSNAPAA